MLKQRIITAVILVVFLLLALTYELAYYLAKTQNQLRKFKDKPYIEALGYAALIILIVFFRGPETEFIYFQF